MQLATEKLSAGYGEKRILNDLSLTLPTGKITALLGPNGCGKSTLLKCFSRLLTPLSGKITIDSEPLTHFSSRKLAKHLALLPQHPLTPEGIAVHELVAYGRSPWLTFWGRLAPHDRHLIQQAMEKTQISHLADKCVTDLSGGQRQRAFLAMVLAQDTPVVLLDEPTTYLDINHQVELMKLLRELNNEGKTVVTVLHDLNQASRYCDHLVLLSQGQVVAQGSPEEVMTPKLLQRVFSIEAEIHPEPVSGKPMCVVC
ncbi:MULTISPECIES: Fe(3+) dicitrate ABC transporter ATP-binding protein FecE [Photorhabdus]|uniref:Iron(III) dicitrate transport ATP-binding protein FecE n=1 Tax=Photorhabdus laumondii subsp. laumondii (strain DSM 15139 / CIP 105565 / TT01) TaxID=243265 RepID=Q7MZ51_PHOLL|nr:MULTISPECIES: Fe(3+) dicitrate ABC transporter ATP-binding protein FecE [Photorhabdus]AXG49301.1 ferric citrate ABC transporter ATP-binding protein FecE [Photorhabdus laumondii subsp. laumondii]NHB62943.1 ferric citrate ABC transporter ATP-binding protein FecE [Photorhabdus sp. RW14-46]CAE16822.1 Iron(III) dicitrate transport ATP-binding protein FecE [Photorhabdus laumondii subsp. laumondii TTO1]